MNDLVVPAFQIIYYPPDRRINHHESMGGAETIDEVGDLILADVTRRTGLDLDIVKKVMVALCRYQIVPGGLSELANLEDAAKLAVVTAALRRRTLL